MNYELNINPPDYRNDTVLMLPPEVSADALAVDAACSGNPGKMEYRGVDLATGAQVFHYGPVYGTNNIGEFLAIVHALALMEQKGLRKTIYSDSFTAITWVRKMQCKTKLELNPKTAGLHEVIAAPGWVRRFRLPTERFRLTSSLLFLCVCTVLSRACLSSVR